MRRFELTDRGKILLTVFPVMIMLIFAGVLIVKGISNLPPAPLPTDQETQTTKTPTQPPPTSPETDVPPTTTQSPPPTGGGFNPPDISPSPPDTTTPGPGDNGQEQPPSPEIGPVGGNPSEGTLVFMFAPGYQEALDSETLTLLNVLLKSPANKRDTLIAVETTRLPDYSSQKLINAVFAGFASYGISEYRILYIMNQNETQGDSAEVSIYFIPVSDK